MTVAWHEDLPQKPLASSWQPKPDKSFLRTEMDSGPAISRLIFTAQIIKTPMAFKMTPAQLATFLTFWETSLKFGALSFTIPHPETGSTITCRNVDTYSTETVGSGHHYIITLSVEILP